MTRIMVDVIGVDLATIVDGLAEHGCFVRGSERSETDSTVRLVVEGAFIPEALEGRLCRCTITQGMDGLSFTRTLQFEAVEHVVEART